MLRASSQFPAVLLCGARQTGKTSLLRRLFPDHRYFTFDDPGLAAQAEANPELFLAPLAERVILDEIQYVPTLFRWLKILIDRDGRRGRFLLTGSQEFPLMRGVSESLAGRCAVVRLPTLSYSEVLGGTSIGSIDFLLAGGYPALWADQGLERDLWFSSYLATCLERDVRNLLQVANLRDFDRFLRALAVRCGQLVSFSDLARDVGIAVSTARAWLSILEAAGHVWLLEPWFRSPGQRLVKTPRLMFGDTGLALHLSGIRSREQLLRSPHLGNVWENFIIGEVRRVLLQAGRSPDLWFWRNRSGSEVDLLMEEGGRYRLFEVKFTENPAAADSRGFHAFSRLYGPEAVAERTIICRAARRFSLPDGTKVLPVEEIPSAF